MEFGCRVSRAAEGVFDRSFKIIMKKEGIDALLKSANSLVAEMTSYKVSTTKRRNVMAIVQEYIGNRLAVNQLLLQRGIRQ